MGRRVDIFGSWCVRELMNLQVCEFLNLQVDELKYSAAIGFL